VRFLGTFDYAMDERGRVPLPPRYRDAFRDGIVLSQGSPDPCVRIFTPEAFEEHATEFTAPSAIHRKGRDLRRILYSSSHHAQLDAQNRLLIPGPLRTFARLAGPVLLVGAGECMEIWEPETYRAELERIESTLEGTLESIEER
jgi:MraZ protein